MKFCLLNGGDMKNFNEVNFSRDGEEEEERFANYFGKKILKVIIIFCQFF